jgi:ACR3 family arsenite efflux pump ArsB
MMQWALSFRIQSDSGGRDLTVHLARGDEAAARVSVRVRIAATLLLCAPLLWTLGQSILRAAGVLAPAGAGIDPFIVRAWAFIGPVIALALNLWWSAHVRMTRSGGRAVSRELSFTLGPASVALILLTAFLVAAFYGHLIADAWACSNGVRSAC